jgi:hypothetical protein
VNPVDFQAEIFRVDESAATCRKQWFRDRGLRFEEVSSIFCVKGALILDETYGHARNKSTSPSFLTGRVFLLEAKWHAEELPASSIYQFKGKLDGKLVGTIGVFVSMSDYSRGAADSLSIGKTINVVLFNKADCLSAMEARCGFAPILRFRLRHAAEHGEPFHP